MRSSILRRLKTNGEIAHLVEHQVRNLRVEGSSPFFSSAPRTSGLIF